MTRPRVGFVVEPEELAFATPDLREGVPLRDYEAFWTNYWRDAYPHLQGVTWPDFIPYYALSSGTTSGATKYIPISRQMLASNQRAALTSLAWFLAADRWPDSPAS